MSSQVAEKTSKDLKEHGINASKVNWNLPTAKLVEQTLQRGEGRLADNGSLVIETGIHTGRSPKDKFTVEEPSSKDKIWWGKVNVPMSEENFDKLLAKTIKHYEGKELYAADLFGGTDPKIRIPIRVINEDPVHNLFAKTMLCRPEPAELDGFNPEYLILNAPTCEADPATEGTNSGTYVVVNFGKKIVLVGGTSYCGEIKKSVFAILNYLYPQKGIMAMHASANVGDKDDTAVFFGLSGTGKTTLSADPTRGLIGDDEHGWGDQGVFNFEGGCYAKCIDLSKEDEPQIYDAIRYGSIVENVVIDPETRVPDYTDKSLTENTRVAYPINYIDNAVIPSHAGHAHNVIFLTCDAFGVLPPISKLTSSQAMYHFLSGYTAKVAGTEKGITEPEATFSTCFGSPFMPLHPTVYAKLLGERIEKHNVNCWLVNTGWVGGPYGVGSRIKIPYTPAMLNAALDGSLADIPTKEHPVFGVLVPESCPGVPTEVLDPRESWDDKAAYDTKAKALAASFGKNFEQFADQASDEIKQAAPKA
jgi:phosphoenolpyruvate carboxykinase (ATP)